MFVGTLLYQVCGETVTCACTVSSIHAASFSSSCVMRRSREHLSPPSKLGQGEKGVVRVGVAESVINTGLPFLDTGAMRDLLSSAPMVLSPPAISGSIVWARGVIRHQHLVDRANATGSAWRAPGLLRVAPSRQGVPGARHRCAHLAPLARCANRGLPCTGP